MNIDIKNLIYQLVPPHKRLPVRLRWLTSLLSPLMELWADFYVWRQKSRMLINVNSQVDVLEGYLRILFGEPIAIKIESYSDMLLWVSLSSETENMQPEFTGKYDPGTAAAAANADTGADAGIYPEIPLAQEIRNRFNDTDFIVYLPAHVDRARVEAEIDKYKQALIRYKIIQK